MAAKSLDGFQKRLGKGREEIPSKTWGMPRPPPPAQTPLGDAQELGGGGGDVLGGAGSVRAARLVVLQANWPLLEGHWMGPSSCSHGLKMGSVIGNFIQWLIACPKATRLP